MLWGAHDEAVHSRHRYTRGELRRAAGGRRARGRCASPTATRCCFPLVARAAHARPPHRPPRLRRRLPARAPGMGVPPPARRWRPRIVRHASLPIGRQRLRPGPQAAREPRRRPAVRIAAMTGTPGDDGERKQVAAELRRVREAVRERALLERAPADVLPPAAACADSRAGAAAPRAGAAGSPAPGPTRPRSTRAGALRRRRRRRRLAPPAPRRLRSWPLLRRPGSSSTRAQVQLDNAILDYVDARLDAHPPRTTTTCWACTAATWARSTSAT